MPAASKLIFAAALLGISMAEPTSSGEVSAAAAAATAATATETSEALEAPEPTAVAGANSESTVQPVQPSLRGAPTQASGKGTIGSEGLASPVEVTTSSSSSGPRSGPMPGSNSGSEFWTKVLAEPDLVEALAAGLVEMPEEERLAWEAALAGLLKAPSSVQASEVGARLASSYLDQTDEKPFWESVFEHRTTTTSFAAHLASLSDDDFQALELRISNCLATGRGKGWSTSTNFRKSLVEASSDSGAAVAAMSLAGVADEGQHLDWDHHFHFHPYGGYNPYHWHQWHHEAGYPHHVFP